MTGVPVPKLVSCAACGGVVSRRAPRCPHCGEEWPGRQAEAGVAARRDRGLANWQVGLIVAVVALVVVGAMMLSRGGRELISFDAGVGPIVEDGDPVGDFLMGEEWDDFEERARPYGISLASADGREVGLGWVCLPDGMNVVLHLGGYYQGDADRDIEVRYRFDGGRPSDTEYWRLFSDNEAAFLPLVLVDGFTKAALAADSVTVRAVDPYDSETFTATFAIAGLDDVLARLAGCTDTAVLPDPF